jgi:hypothetical protein
MENSENPKENLAYNPASKIDQTDVSVNDIRPKPSLSEHDKHLIIISTLL